MQPCLEMFWSVDATSPHYACAYLVGERPCDKIKFFELELISLAVYELVRLEAKSDHVGNLERQP